MKLLTFISALLISSLLHAQFVQGEDVRKKNSARNLQFCFDNAAEKIENGICREFVYQAVKLSHPKDVDFVLSHISKFRIKDSSKVISGDVVLFTNVVYDNSGVYDTTIGHIGIVLDMVLPDGFYYVAQNEGKKGEEMIKVVDKKGNDCEVFADSNVNMAYFEYKSKKNGIVSFYRF